MPRLIPVIQFNRIKPATLLWTALVAAVFGSVGCAPAPEPSKDETLERSPTSYLTRDLRDEVMYFVLPDRFNNANSANDNGNPDKPISFGGYAPESPFGFHGGDIQGIEAKLDYLQGLGVTSIWMTPILRNKATQGDSFAHHGYWIVDFTELDPHFGTNDDLKSLIAAAHQRDIKIFFDIITNHTADVIKYEECHNPDGSLQTGNRECAFKPAADVATGDRYTPFLLDDEKDVKVPAWLNDINLYNNQGDSFWQGESALKGDFVGLDDIDTTQQIVVDGFIDIYKNLITEFKPDGFRIDTVKHVDLSFWQAFAPAIVEHAQSIGIPNFHIFGEVYSADPEVLSQFTTRGKMPSVLDFGFQQFAADAIFRNKGTDGLVELFNNDDYYRDADSHPDLLMNFLGNHDMGRAGFFIQQAAPNDSADRQLAKMKLAHELMYMSRGIPVIYYGDEQGFTGDGGDVAARESMFASQVDSYNDNEHIGSSATPADDNFDISHPIYQHMAKLAALRSRYPALSRGLTLPRKNINNSSILAVSRVEWSSKQELLTVFNVSDQEQKVTMPMWSNNYQLVWGNANSIIDHDESLTMTVPAFTSALLVGSELNLTPLPQDLALTAYQPVGERFLLEFGVEPSPTNAIPLVNVEVKLKQEDGSLRDLGSDNTPPYRLLLTEALTASAELVVTWSSPDGTKSTKSIKVTTQN